MKGSENELESSNESADHFKTGSYFPGPALLILRFHSIQCIAVAVLFVCGLTSGTVTGQEQASSDTVETTQPPEAPESVNVRPEARDDEISSRLEEILQSTEWFESPQVYVDNGVVFLKGVALKEEFKSWAGELASNTQDVAAVVNEMSLRQRSIWDFSPAMKELREFQAGAIQSLPLVLFGIVLLILTWFAAKLAGFLFGRFFKKRIPNSLLRWVATRLAMLPVIVFGIYLVLRVSGLTQLALTVLGGTGLVGLIIGIAFQDIAENFLASILISVRQPFRIGDLIQIGEHTGIVDRVTTRGTTVLTVDGNHVQIPNSHVYKNTIVNFTANPLRRISFVVGIGYDDSASKSAASAFRLRQEPWSQPE